MSKCQYEQCRYPADHRGPHSAYAVVMDVDHTHRYELTPQQVRQLITWLELYRSGAHIPVRCLVFEAVAGGGVIIKAIEPAAWESLR